MVAIHSMKRKRSMGKMSSRRAKKRATLREFTPFPRLPPEIQAIIWEMTFPEPRLIEVVEFWPDSPGGPDYCKEHKAGWGCEGCKARRAEEQAQLAATGGSDGLNNPDASSGPNGLSESNEPDDLDDSLFWDDESELSDAGDYIGFRLASRLSAFLEIENGCISTWAPRMEACPLPIALHVCRESRAAALRHYVPMIDPIADARSFYFSPRRDVFWFSTDITDEGPAKIAQLRQHYGEQVDQLKHLLVDENLWDFPKGPVDYCSRMLPTFRGIKQITILLDSIDFTETDEEIPMDPADYPPRADWLAARDARVLRGRDWTLEYIDWEENVYRRVSLKDLKA